MTNSINIFKSIILILNKGHKKLVTKAIDEYYKGPDMFFIDLWAWLNTEASGHINEEVYTQISLVYHCVKGGCYDLSRKNKNAL